MRAVNIYIVDSQRPFPPRHLYHRDIRTIHRRCCLPDSILHTRLPPAKAEFSATLLIPELVLVMTGLLQVVLSDESVEFVGNIEDYLGIRYALLANTSSFLVLKRLDATIQTGV